MEASVIRPKGQKEHPSRPGRKCDCLNWCGDDPWLKDGRADPCEHRIKIEQEAAELALWRLCRWKDVNKELPDADETVLVALIDNTEPVWLGYYDGERWLDVEGIPAKVSHWAPMPEAPEVDPHPPSRHCDCRECTRYFSPKEQPC